MSRPCRPKGPYRKAQPEAIPVSAGPMKRRTLLGWAFSALAGETLAQDAQSAPAASAAPSAPVNGTLLPLYRPADVVAGRH